MVEDNENGPQSDSEANLEGAAGRPALSAHIAPLDPGVAVSEPQEASAAGDAPEEGAERTVQYESATQFAQRNNVPLNRLRELNPDGLDDAGNIKQPKLKIV